MKTRTLNLKNGALLLVSGCLCLLVVACQGGKGKVSEEAVIEMEKTDPPETDLHAAALLGDLDAIRGHIAAGSDLDVAEPSMGSSPLITASVFGKTEVARILVEAGADVNLQNQEGSTALHTAAFLCRVEIVELLLENGADRDLKNIYGSTPLQSVEGPWEEVASIYGEFSKNLGPLGLKLDDEYIRETRPLVAKMLRDGKEI